ncbi:SIMPL domain-containing protein [Ottowia sp.]|uniref:SIMPL domain-containing protein n=1 Tax=Ottowia sp. TaxID=1898956 RepID=UPI002C9EBDA2|nr:SIMPL domain-containing protein [Ottowia sp.]HOB66645.1 SIMPL domain-containing protein [Ottowia sp.]HPZ56981.1 SIMPL domain-containing protein [Ottowia sp.]HQD47458.1 SIMPL domain-containing protein [Ottowia sp.]
MKKPVSRWAALALFAAAFGAASVHAQPANLPAAMTFAVPQNVLQLSATGQVEVMQDLLTLSLTTAREGADAANVQAELRKTLDAALAQVKTTAQPGQMDVLTGDFSIHPRYNRDGKISGWQGRAELVLEGRDFPRITQAAARAAGMTIGNVAFGLSREQRARVEGEAQSIAIERFKAKAGEIAKAFGFAGYSLREVAISGDSEAPMPRMYGMAKAQAMAADAPVPVEPGKTLVQVTVSGTVQAR